MSQYSAKGKDKSHSLETCWSEWEWNADGYWEKMRTNASGATEYRTEPPLNQPSGNATMPGAAGVLDEQYTPLPHSESNQLSSLKATYAGSHTTADYSVSDENESSAGTYSGSYITADYSNLDQFSNTGGPVESHPNGSKQNEWECYPPTSRLSFASPKRIRREPGSQDHEALDPRYHVVPSNESENFWRIGRVFVMLSTEPAGRTGGAIGNGSHITTVWLNKHTYSEIRRFVVVRVGHGSAVCLAIHTYAGRATLKPNVPNRKQHAIIYTGTQCPQEHSEVTSDGIVIYKELVLDPIRVNSEQKSPEGTLSPLSRVNFSKIYTVEKDILVLNIGVVSKACIPILEANSPLKTSFVREKDGIGSRAGAMPLSQIMDAENASSIPQESDSEANLVSKANATNTSRKLNDRYQIIHTPSRFFKNGRVFKTLWTEPAGDVTDTEHEFVIPSRYGEIAFTKIRHFVVVREKQGCSLCLMLNTYHRQGASKNRIRADNYAAVYPVGGEVRLSPDENLTKAPFPIKVEEAREYIDPTSRINFGRLYTVEHNIKVLKVGRIPNEHLPRLDEYFVNSIVGPQAAGKS